MIFVCIYSHKISYLINPKQHFNAHHLGIYCMEDSDAMGVMRGTKTMDNSMKTGTKLK